MASALVFFNKRRRQKQRNGFINDEVPVVENGYEPQESDEDEVFLQDPNLELSASKPLMHPRTKSQRARVQTRTIECRCCTLCKPVLYFVALVTVLCVVMATIVYIANRHEGRKNSGKPQLNNNKNNAGDHQHGGGVGGSGSGSGATPTDKERTVLIGCDSVSVEDVWVVGFPKLLTESAFRLVDVNGDGVDDVILGFATGADGHGVNTIVCDLYFGGQRPCLGGVMALEGQTGKELWRRYTDHEVYGLNCQYDVNKDGVKDCLASGRAGTLVCVDGSSGSLLWSLGRQSHAVNPVMNVYTPQFVPDMDADGLADVVIIHGGDPLQEAGSQNRLSGRIIFLSGKTGVVLRWVGLPDGRESYYSPQVMTGVDGTQVVLFGTGGETHNGSLWRIELDSLKKGQINRAVKISSDSHKGFMTPPALADVTGDGTPDILVPSFNSTLLAIDGKNFRPLWSVHFPSSESYSTPAVGYYNDDDVPDVLVKYAHGPGFPVYYYSQTTVLDGKTGKKLIDPPLQDTIGSQSSPLSIGMEGSGNDLFLVWMADCKGHEGAQDEFTFTKGTTQKEKSKSDLCGLRFQSQQVSRLVALGRNLPREGVAVYHSETRTAVEHSQWINTSAKAYEYVMKHPEILDDYSTDSWRDGVNAAESEPAEPGEPGEFYNNNNRPYSNSNTHRSSSKKGPAASTGTGTRARTRVQDDMISSSKGYNPIYSNTNQGSSRLSPSVPYASRVLLKPSSRSQAYSRQNSLTDSDNTDDNVDEYEFPFREISPNYGNPFGQYLGNNEDNSYSSNYPYGSGRYPSAGVGRNSRRRGRRGRGGQGRNWRSRRKRRDVFHTTRKNERRRRRAQSLPRRPARHVGPHDGDGIQRLISTGTLVAPLLPLDHSDYNSSLDLVIATYWSFPSQVNQLLLARDQKCIADRMAKEGVDRFDANGPYYKMSHDQYEMTVTNECLEHSGQNQESSGSRQTTYAESDGDYNPFNLHMGQMTVYRLRLKFTCSSSPNKTEPANSRCATVLPFAKQKWAAYMGSNGDSYWSIPFQ